MKTPSRIERAGTAGRPGRERPLTAALCALVLTLAAPARAQSSADDLARTHFDSGAAYLEQSDYESALREFRAAYDLSKRPEILINMATVDERMGRLEDAVNALDLYLRDAPQGDHAETVKIRVENLRKRLAEQKAAAAAAPAAPPTGSTPATARPAPPPPSKPAEEYHAPSRLPAYLFFGGAGAAAIASVVTGVMASGEHSDAKSHCSPTCTDDQLSAGRTLAITSTVLTGVAVAAGAVGAVLWFTADDGRAGGSAGIGAVPGGIAARGQWRF